MKKQPKPTREQQFAEEAEYIANRYWTLYIALLKRGFTQEQAFHFTLQYITR